MKKSLHKREQKYSLKPNNAFSPVRPFFIYPWTTPKRAAKIMYNILHNFFFLQWRQKFHLTHRPLVSVNDPLDTSIPFTPSYVKTYLSFVQYFLKPLDYIYKRFGLSTGRKYASRTINFIALLYNNSSKIYKFCMSTTPRPDCKNNRQFKTIHFWDPHFLCVPSLHVEIAAGLYAWFTQLFNEMIEQGLLSKSEADQRLAQFYEEGIAIIESVLFIKQHSVNCIPTALYLVTATMYQNNAKPFDFSAYINDIFKKNTDLPPQTKLQLQNHFHTFYNTLINESQTAATWDLPLKNWLSSRGELHY